MTKLFIENANKEAPASIRIYPLDEHSQVIAPDSFTSMDDLGLSFGIVLAPGPVPIQCDGAYDTIGIQGNLDYSTGWTIYLNGQDYGRATDETPLEYRSDWEFDFKIQVYSSEGNILRITNTSDGDLRIKLKPDVVLPNMSMTFIDDDLDYQERPSENVTVMDDGSVNVCLRSSGIIGGGA